jgi:hypothetical protein
MPNSMVKDCSCRKKLREILLKNVTEGTLFYRGGLFCDKIICVFIASASSLSFSAIPILHRRFLKA